MSHPPGRLVGGGFVLAGPRWGLRFCMVSKLPGDAHTAGLQTTLCISQIPEVIAEKEQRDLWGIPFPSGLCLLSCEGWGSGERFSHSGLGGMASCVLRPCTLWGRLWAFCLGSPTWLLLLSAQPPPSQVLPELPQLLPQPSHPLFPPSSRLPSPS